MKASDYRKQFDARLVDAATKKAVASRGVARAETVEQILAELTNKRLGPRRRVAAVRRAGERAVKRPRVMNTLIRLLADPAERNAVRRAALSAIEANTFKTVEFRRYAAAYHEALRGALADEDPTLRTEAMDILALNKDAHAQRLLAEGLRRPRRALVPPLQAVRMLGYDVHAGHFPLFRQIVQTTKRPRLRRAALRLLAADSGSVPLMTRIASNRAEDNAARTIAAVALQSLSPRAFARLARTVVLDDDDADDVRASVISAITHGPATPGREVSRKVREIDSAPGGTTQLNRAARQFTVARTQGRRPD